MSARTLVVRTTSPEETRAVGAAFAKALPPGAVVSVEGPLGAGKTEFIRGFCAALGVEDAVTSPTYTLANEYATERGRRVLHVDAFRLAGPDELRDLDLDARGDAKGFLLVEWGERVADALPAERAEVRLAPDGDEESARRITVSLPESMATALPAGIVPAEGGAAHGSRP